jgi:hypothetical protein
MAPNPDAWLRRNIAIVCGEATAVTGSAASRLTASSLAKTP